MGNRIREGLLEEIEREASRRQAEALLLLRLKQNLRELARDHPLWARANAAWAAWCEIVEDGGCEASDRVWECPRQLLMTYGRYGETSDPCEFLSMFSDAVELGVRVCVRTGTCGPVLS